MNANLIKFWRTGVCRGCGGHFRKLIKTDDLCGKCRDWDHGLRLYAIASAALRKLRP